jgi:CheY-like chemotaxis protein
MATKTHHLLLAEDSFADLVLFRRAFDQINLVPTYYVVNDGELAIQYLKGAGQYTDRTKFPLPWLAVLDIHMPKLTGLEVLEWIRKESELKDLAVIMLSSTTDPADIQRAYDQGITAFLNKPVQADQLRTTINELISHVDLSKELHDDHWQMKSSQG